MGHPSRKKPGNVPTVPRVFRAFYARVARLALHGASAPSVSMTSLIDIGLRIQRMFGNNWRNSAAFGFLGLLIATATIRIILIYPHLAQGFDEPCHVAAGIEYLDRGTYLLDPVHPPLSRIAIALPLYLAGERYPDLPQNDLMSQNYNVVGNHILYDSGHLLRNLRLARLGVL